MGYYGNLCGDADGDGLNEIVSAATLDVNADVYAFITAGVFGKDWNRPIQLGLDAPWELVPEHQTRGQHAKYTYRRNLLFRDLVSGGSSALSPMITTASSTLGALDCQEATYMFSARPCVTFLANRVDYVVDWGSDGIETLSAPASGITVNHIWKQPGTHTLHAYLDRDSVGRDLMSPATSRQISVETKSDINRGPTVTLGNDRSVTPGSNVSIDSTASDPDHGELLYTWVQISGPSVSFDASAPNIAITGPAASEQIFLELTVTDDRGATASDQITIRGYKPAQPDRPRCGNCGLRRCLPW